MTSIDPSNGAWLLRQLRPSRRSAPPASSLRACGWTTAVGLCQPDVFDSALAARAQRSLANVKIRSLPDDAAARGAGGGSRGRTLLWFSWHFSGYDRKKHDAGRCNYMPLNLGEVPDYYRRFIDPVGHRHSQDLPDGRERLFQFQRRQSLAPRRGRTRPDGDRRGRAEACRTSTASETRRPHQRGGLHDRRRPTMPRAGAAESAAERSRPRGGAAASPRRSRTALACRSGSAACPTPSARCSSKAACATSASTPRC